RRAEPPNPPPLLPPRGGVHPPSRYPRAARGPGGTPPGKNDHRGRPEQNNPNPPPPAGGARKFYPRTEARTKGHLPSGARLERRAARGLLAGHRPVLRPDQPRLHGL